MIVLPDALNSASRPSRRAAADLDGDRLLPTASFIWEATVRFQISSYSRNWSPVRPVSAGVRKRSPEGRIASCASCAFLTLPGVDARLVRQVVGAVQLRDLRAGGGDRGLRQRRGVRTHVGDEAVLVQLLRHLHGRLRAEAQLAAGLLLQRRRTERRVRRAAVRLATRPTRTANDASASAAASARAFASSRCRTWSRLLSCPSEPKSRPWATRWPSTAFRRAANVRRVGGVPGAAGGEGAGQVPVLGGAEGDALALPLDDQPGRDGLDAAGRQPRHDLLPQDRRDLVAVEAVEDAAGLLGVDQALVELARVGDGVLDRVLGDLVEDHPVDRDLGLEHLLQVPGDGLALAVLIGGEEELVGLGEQLLELPDLRLLVGVDDVERLEVVLDVDAEAAHARPCTSSGTSAAPFGRSRMCPTLASTT